MQVKWNNLIAFALVVFAFVAALQHPRELRLLLGTIDDIGPGHTPEEMTVGLIVFGLILVAVVAAVKLLTQNRGGKQ